MASDAGSRRSPPHNTVAILMVPFPLQGHLNQLLHLSRLISARGLLVHFAAAPSHSRQARLRAATATAHDHHDSTITFHEIPSLPYPSPSPDPNSTTRFPTHLQPMIEATSSLREPVAEILRDLCTVNRRVVVVHDSMMGSVIQDFVRYPNAEAYTFHSVSAYAIFLFLWESAGRPFDLPADLLQEKDIPSLDGCFSPEFRSFVQTQHEFIKLNSGRVYNTCRAVEGLFMELIERAEISGGKKQWALGPFNPIGNPERTGVIYPGSRHACLKWLDGLEPGSVVLVSFGTTTTFPRKQIHELAIGLENSGQKFVWVLRDADVGDGAITKHDDDIIALPEGFEGSVEGRGLVVRAWAPQVEILGHEAVGGFVSHCGWNSCMESISMGVAMGAWPMHSDQPRNAVLVTKVLGVGITVRKWARRDEIVGAREVEQGVRRLMGPGEGAEVRRRAAELGRAVREAAEEDGGPMRLEWDSFISHIIR